MLLEKRLVNLKPLSVSAAEMSKALVTLYEICYNKG